LLKQKILNLCRFQNSDFFWRNPYSILQKIRIYAIYSSFLTHKTREDEVDTHFIFGLVLVGFAFWLCFKFRKKK
jgi:hypothetical protein